MFDMINLNDDLLLVILQALSSPPSMSKSTMGMVPNQHWSTLDLPLILCPTSKVEFLNPIVSSRVDNIVPNPPSFKKHLHDSTPPLH
jgi:hypothetical protein